MAEIADKTPRFPFVLVDVDAECADEISSELFDLGSGGVEERDATTLVKGAAGKTTLVASFASRELAEEARGAFDASMNPRIEEIVGDAWRDEWKKYFHPFLLCEGLVVAPPWEKYDGALGDARVLELEPGRAFGTGLHETTSLVAQALAKHAGELADRDILDVGCGSGILALVGLVLGATHARGIDNDADVIGVVRENAARNGLAEKIEADATPIEEITKRYPVVVANIEAEVLAMMAPSLTRCMAEHGLLILSGILAVKRDRVVTAFDDLELLEEPARGEWIALVFRKP
ncbi:MAG: 50S ribosomal protein L11 methyltransferase [Polyangiaceae bacterium]